jgi:hypothetical protein
VQNKAVGDSIYIDNGRKYTEVLSNITDRPKRGLIVAEICLAVLGSERLEPVNVAFSVAFATFFGPSEAYEPHNRHRT